MRIIELTGLIVYTLSTKDMEKQVLATIQSGKDTLQVTTTTVRLEFLFGKEDPYGAIIPVDALKEAVRAYLDANVSWNNVITSDLIVSGK